MKLLRSSCRFAGNGSFEDGPVTRSSRGSLEYVRNFLFVVGEGTRGELRHHIITVI